MRGRVAGRAVMGDALRIDYVGDESSSWVSTADGPCGGYGLWFAIRVVA